MFLSEITHMVVDVDGTMTDGSIYYDEHGNEEKKFNTKDAVGFFAAKAANIEIIVITGRESNATKRRMKDLGICSLYQGVKDKVGFLSAFMENEGLQKKHLAYIGDDLNDYAAMSLAQYVCCPADACNEIKQIADYISVRQGGNGAVRDAIEHLLSKRNEWDSALAQVIKRFSAGT